MSRELLQITSYDGSSQFTVDGIDVAIEYYNQKYPDRPRINHVICNAQGNEVDFRAEVKSQTDALLRAADGEPVKIIFTTYHPEIGGGTKKFLNHSTPVLLDDEKLILLRDEIGLSVTLLKNLARISGLDLIRQKVDFSETEITSIQGDSQSCAAIALGILKDLTRDDFGLIAGFLDGYTPLSKMLKYSQSLHHIMSFRSSEDEESGLENSIVKVSDGGDAIVLK